MERYKNLAGNSNIIAYEIGADSIIVEFGDASRYLYNYGSTGRTDIETMKTLALCGRGLNSFISTSVKTRYARKLR